MGNREKAESAEYQKAASAFIGFFTKNSFSYG
jgi:hypothetical protein